MSALTLRGLPHGRCLYQLRQADRPLALKLAAMLEAEGWKVSWDTSLTIGVAAAALDGTGGSWRKYPAPQRDDKRGIADLLVGSVSQWASSINH